MRMNCLDEKTLSSYLDERLLQKERKTIEAHISECKHCLSLLLVAYESERFSKKCPQVLNDKIKRRLGLKGKRARSELKWLFGALSLFILSFIFRRYFLQFLIASSVLGFKWAMEGEGAKRAVMIFKGMHKSETTDSPQDFTRQKTNLKP
jgi:hypothetical protein